MHLQSMNCSLQCINLGDQLIRWKCPKNCFIFFFFSFLFFFLFFFILRRNINHLCQVLLYARRIFYKIDLKNPLNPEAANLWVPVLLFFSMYLLTTVCKIKLWFQILAVFFPNISNCVEDYGKLWRPFAKVFFFSLSGMKMIEIISNKKLTCHWELALMSFIYL